MHGIREYGIRIGAAVLLAAALQAGGTAQARERLESNLSGDGGANGRVRAMVSDPARGRFEIRARGLAANQSFDVMVGSVKVGTLLTTGGGQGQLRFRSRPRGRDLLLGFDPRGALITLRDANGVDVLLGTVPTAASSGGNDGSKIICCVPDDSGSECEDRTPEQCTAQGGTPAAATSCLPNPCADAPPVETDVVCCIPDDSGPECEDRTVAECAAQGGVVIEATSCTDNPCAATPPADPDIQCCIPDDSGAECEDRTPAQCAAQGGIDMGPGTCTPNPCADVSTPAGSDDKGGAQGARADDGGGHGGHGGHGGDDASRPSYY